MGGITEKESYIVELQHRLIGWRGGEWQTVDSSLDPNWVYAMASSIDQGKLGDEYSQYRLVEKRERVLAGVQD